MVLTFKIVTHFQKKEYWFCKRSIEMSMEMPIDVKLVAIKTFHTQNLCRRQLAIVFIYIFNAMRAFKNESKGV